MAVPTSRGATGDSIHFSKRFDQTSSHGRDALEADCDGTIPLWREMKKISPKKLASHKGHRSPIQMYPFHRSIKLARKISYQQFQSKAHFEDLARSRHWYSRFEKYRPPECNLSHLGVPDLRSQIRRRERSTSWFAH